MCGIAGFTHRTRINDDLIRDVTHSLVHRGPDCQDVYQSRGISLGAVRLKIIDLEGGDQPMASPDGDTVIAFNGEIYNYAEVRDELSSRGHVFRTRSDTEVFLRAFLEWDVECLRRLRGMFAVALWTESSRRLVLARDRMGIKPLYYYVHGQELFFGSELKTILAHPEVERRLDLQGLNYYLSLNYVPCPYTLIQGIRKLPPGHWLEWRDGRVRSEVWWQLDARPDPNWRLESAKEELDGLMRESVREHLISDVPLGVWVSGGLDSSSIVHYAAQMHPRIKTFSISFLGKSCDESRYFREVASLYGTDHHEFDVNTDMDLPAAVEDFSYFSDEPSADAGALPMWYLSRMTRQHVTVALSGEGADELFGGYLTYRADALARWLRRTPAGLRRMALRGLAYWPVSDAKVSLEYKLKRFLAGSLQPPDDAHCYWNGTFSSTEQKAFYDRPDGGGIAELYGVCPTPGAGFLARHLWFDQYYYLPDDILYKCDRISMAHSLEVRPPFLDHRIVEFAGRLPDRLKISGSSQKHVLRELMRGKLPESVLGRKKEGFDVPAHEWFRGVLRPMLLDTLTPEAVRRTGVFRPDGVQAILNAHLGRRANFGYHLWGLLTLFLWMKRWGVEADPGMMASDESPGLISVN